MYRGSNIQYELGDRVRAIDVGGIGALRRLARHTRLVETIDDRVQVLKRNLLRARARNRWNAERLVTRS